MLTATEIFTDERIAILKAAMDDLTAIRDEVAQAAFHAPSDVRGDGPRAQDYGAAGESADAARHALTNLLINATVRCGVADARVWDDNEDE